MLVLILGVEGQFIRLRERIILERNRMLSVQSLTVTLWSISSFQFTALSNQYVYSANLFSVRVSIRCFRWVICSSVANWSWDDLEILSG
jgi:hypothetical protein